MAPWLRNFSITGKVTLLFTLVTSLFLLAISGTLYLYARHELRTTITTNQTASISALVDQLDEKLSTADRYLLHLSGHLSKDLQRHATLQTLGQTVNHHDEAFLFFDAGLMLISPTGTIIAASPRNDQWIGLDVGSRDFFRQPLTTQKSFVSMPFRCSLPPHDPVIVFSAPVLDGQGTVRAVLAGRYSLSSKGFLHKLLDTPIGKSGYFYIFNQQRTLIIHPEQSRLLTTLAAGKNQAMDRAVSGQEGTWENINSVGLPGLTSIKKLRTVPWYLAVHFPLTEAYAPLLQAKFVFFTLLAIAVLLSLAAARLIIHPFVDPLNRLTNHIKLLDQKKGPDRFLPVTSNDEIGHLTSVFNELLQELDDEFAARSEAADFYRIVAENTNEVAVWQLPDKSVRFISPNCEAIFNHLDAEFYADPDLLEQLIHPEDRVKWHEHVAGACLPKNGLELRMCAMGGHVRWFRHHCHQVLGAHNQLLGIRSSFLDVTRQKESQEVTAKALARATHAKREWEETLDCIDDVVMLVDKGQRIQRTNKRISTLTGCTFDELVGKDWRDLLQEHGFGFTVFRNNSGEIFHQESGRFFDVFFYPIQHDDESCMVVTMHDSTELRTATEQLQVAYDNLEKTQMKVFQQEKLASIGQLAAGVAHEINNPMGFISSNLTSLKKYGVRLDEYIAALQGSLFSCSNHPDLSEIDALRQKLKVDYIISDITQLIDESLDGAERVRKIVADLKSFSRVDDAKFTPARINDCLDSTINIVWNELKYVADIDRQYGELPMVPCYPQQLNQVFMNLLINAAHAMTGRGMITVKTWHDDQNIFVAISDTGKGIPSEHLERIFEPFFTTKEVGKGTGLGLSICYDIIKKHNGEISVASTLGAGSTFTVRLPFSGPQQIGSESTP